MRPALITLANERAAKASARSPYPHMSPADTAVWEIFLELHLVEFVKVYYDVGVGGKGATQLGPEASDRPMWVSLLKKRIDAVVVRVRDVWTCEVKPTANMSSLGQSLTYAHQFKEEGRTELPVRPVVIASRIDLDVEDLFIRYDVLAFAVQRDELGRPSLVKQVGAFAP